MMSLLANAFVSEGVAKGLLLQNVVLLHSEPLVAPPCKQTTSGGAVHAVSLQGAYNSQVPLIASEKC